MKTARLSLRAARLEVARLRTALADAARRETYQALLLRALRRSFPQAHATE